MHVKGKNGLSSTDQVLLLNLAFLNGQFPNLNWDFCYCISLMHGTRNETQVTVWVIVCFLWILIKLVQECVVNTHNAM